MATTDNKLRSIAAVLGIGSLALVGVSACDDNGAADDTDDTGIENGDDGVEDEGVEDDGMEDDGMEEEDEGDL